MWFLGTGGLAASTALCSYLQVAILMTVLRRRLGPTILDGFMPAFWKTVLATLCMTGAVVIAFAFSKGVVNMFKFSKGIAVLFKLLLAVPSGAAVYLLAAKFLRIEMLSLLTGARQIPLSGNSQ
jgi:peptidoglycan biosynthesis protein MviN/MurJ (putative lipid II flippase)